ncbi:MAG: hypothetical protein QXP42_04370 [Candidatus Micrarchaeia archaeon]
MKSEEIKIDSKKAAALLFLIVLVLLALFLYPFPRGTQNEFISALNASTHAAIVMNITETDSSAVINCGIELAKALGEMNKTVKNYAIDGELCVMPDLSNSTPQKCISDFEGMPAFLLMGGPSNSISYEKNMVVVRGTPDYMRECAIKGILKPLKPR